MRTPWTLLMLVLLSLAALSIGCSDDSGTGPVGDPIAFPLATGNSWVYQTSSTSGRAGGASVDSSSIVGTQLIDGDSYYVLESRELGETDEIYLRQVGQQLHMVAPTLFGDGSRGGDLDMWLGRVLDESFPWRFADFGVPSGTRWTLAQAETTFVLGRGGGETVEVLITGESHGRSSVTVPAGSFQDVYEGEIEFLITLGTLATESGTQTLWIADGIGLVKQINAETTVEGGVKTDMSTRTEELTSYQIE